MVIVDQVIDNMVHEGADDKAKDITEVEDEGTKLMGMMMCYNADGRGDGGGDGSGGGDGQ